jgi:hypothetical protein
LARGLYPKPPDMRLARTQDLTDGELFYIIERGVPLTWLQRLEEEAFLRGGGDPTDAPAPPPSGHGHRH